MQKWIYVVLVLSIAGIGGFSVHAASSAHEKHLNVSRMNVDDEFKDTDGTSFFTIYKRSRHLSITENGQIKDKLRNPPLKS
ncbi:putative beta-lactamase YbxI [Bacillus subtilis]|nr:putative beta-lactamase YbxI [Bacillus subtilis]